MTAKVQVVDHEIDALTDVETDEHKVHYYYKPISNAKKGILDDSEAESVVFYLFYKKFREGKKLPSGFEVKIPEQHIENKFIPTDSAYNYGEGRSFAEWGICYPVANIHLVDGTYIDEDGDEIYDYFVQFDLVVNGL
jgi:hypothetical protein